MSRFTLRLGEIGNFRHMTQKSPEWVPKDSLLIKWQFVSCTTSCFISPVIQGRNFLEQVV